MLPPSPKANCEETSWVAIQSVQDKNIRECKERRTCNSSNYFSSKEDCEESCALSKYIITHQSCTNHCYKS